MLIAKMLLFVVKKRKTSQWIKGFLGILGGSTFIGVKKIIKGKAKHLDY